MLGIHGGGGGPSTAYRLGKLDGERQEGGEPGADEPLRSAERCRHEPSLQAWQLCSQEDQHERDQSDAQGTRRGGDSPGPGSRRLTSALKMVPTPITAKVIVIDTLAWSRLGSSGPSTSGSEGGSEQHNAYRPKQRRRRDW